MPSTFRSRFALPRVIAASLLTLGSVYGASFTISSPSTSAQTLGSASGQTGVVTATGTLTVSGGTNAVAITGNNATLTNLGTISQTGTGRAVRDNTGVTGLIINNGSTTNSTALMKTADADVLQMNVANGSVTLNNYGTMNSLNASVGGAQAVDFNAITTGANTINNFAGALMLASEADAVRPGVNGIVNNSGTIQSTRIANSTSGTDGIDAQANTGVNITNETTGLIDGARHGITGGAANSTVLFNTTVTNNGNGIIRGNDGAGINLDGFNANQTATVTNHGTISGNGLTGDGDGVDIDGLGFITNTGAIKSLNAFSATTPAQSEGITVGGGTILNSGTIEGLVAAGNTNAVGRGISLLGNDAPGGGRDPLYGSEVVTNQSGGLILGQSDSGIAVGGPASGFTVTINNNAGGTIQGGGTLNAAVLTGFDNDTVNDSGLIDGSSSGKAISLGGGDDTFNLTGGTASILGSIDGGDGNNLASLTPGAGNTFEYAGSLLNFKFVDVYSGLVELDGVSTYTGATDVFGGTLELNGSNRLSANSALNLAGGALEAANGGANGQTFSCLSVTGNSSIDLDSTSSVTFNGLCAVTAGDKLAISDYLDVVSPAYAIRFAGDETADPVFLALLANTTVNGENAVAHYDGQFTDVTAAPEPSTFALFGLAGALLLAVRRRA